MDDFSYIPVLALRGMKPIIGIGVAKYFETNILAYSQTWLDGCRRHIRRTPAHRIVQIGKSHIETTDVENQVCICKYICMYDIAKFEYTSIYTCTHFKQIHINKPRGPQPRPVLPHRLPAQVNGDAVLVSPGNVPESWPEPEK